jgi:hypothetical protein
MHHIPIHLWPDALLGAVGAVSDTCRCETLASQLALARLQEVARNAPAVEVHPIHVGSNTFYLVPSLYCTLDAEGNRILASHPDAAGTWHASDGQLWECGSSCASSMAAWLYHYV